MKKMKRVLACAMAAVMTASLAACGSSEKETAAAKTEATKTAETTKAAEAAGGQAVSGEKATVTF